MCIRDRVYRARKPPACLPWGCMTAVSYTHLPLSNPAGANLQLLGVYDPQLAEPLAYVLHNLGVKRGLVVCGSDGLDEVTLLSLIHI